MNAPRVYWLIETVGDKKGTELTWGVGHFTGFEAENVVLISINYLISILKSKIIRQVTELLN